MNVKEAKHRSPRNLRVGAGVALLASVAMVVGYFLPWTSLSPTIESELGLQSSNLVFQSNRSEHAVEVSNRLARNEAVSGHDWATLLGAIETERNLEEPLRRRIEVARVGVKSLAFAAGALAVLLVLLSVSGEAARRRLGVVASWPFRLAQSNLASSAILVVVVALGLVACLTAGAMWIDAQAEESRRSGVGLILMASGGGIAFLSALWGYGPGRRRAFLCALGLVVLLGAATALRVLTA